MNSRFKILFVCRDNASRSLMAEHIIRSVSPERFESFSAGPAPAAQPHPLTITVLSKHFEVDLSNARCKSWDEFRDTEFDFVVTLSEHELPDAPDWRGHPMLAHWTEPDPAAAQGEPDLQERAFWQTAEEIARRIRIFASLPAEKLESLHASAAA
ncbi:protein-tyrosine-phosphatase [Verrucomicrobia bacterium LW23]|nr:protein-tyrosine-phosphatase [Verrucomicrobia bacterium LW23]